MAQNYKIEDTLKNLPFYSEEIKKSKKKKIFYLNYHCFIKNYVIFIYQKSFHSLQKDLKDLKD